MLSDFIESQEAELVRAYWTSPEKVDVVFLEIRRDLLVSAENRRELNYETIKGISMLVVDALKEWDECHEDR